MVLQNNSIAIQPVVCVCVSRNVIGEAVDYLMYSFGVNSPLFIKAATQTTNKIMFLLLSADRRIGCIQQPDRQFHDLWLMLKHIS